MTISRENQLYQISTNAKLSFAIQNQINANELEEIFENDENLRREYLDFYSTVYQSLNV